MLEETINDPERYIPLLLEYYMIYEEGENIADSLQEYTYEDTYMHVECTNEEAEKLYYVYAWVVEGRYYLQDEEIKQDSSSSIPFVFVVEKIDEEYVVTDSRIPRDGSYYEKDMKNIFPLSVRYDMEQMQLDGSIEKMILEVEEKASLYFHK
mgnify:CR=1 FL=1